MLGSSNFGAKTQDGYVKDCRSGMHTQSKAGFGWSGPSLRCKFRFAQPESFATCHLSVLPKPPQQSRSGANCLLLPLNLSRHVFPGTMHEVIHSLSSLVSRLSLLVSLLDETSHVEISSNRKCHTKTEKLPSECSECSFRASKARPGLRGGGRLRALEAAHRQRPHLGRGLRMLPALPRRGKQAESK